MAAIAASASGARPRLVCSTTPVALITGASDGSANRTTAVRTAASHPSGGAVPPLARALSTATRAAFTTSARGWSARRAATPGPASSESTEGRFRLGSLIWEVRGGWWRWWRWWRWRRLWRTWLRPASGVDRHRLRHREADIAFPLLADEIRGALDPHDVGRLRFQRVRQANHDLIRRNGTLREELPDQCRVHQLPRRPHGGAPPTTASLRRWRRGGRRGRRRRGGRGRPRFRWW